MTVEELVASIGPLDQEAVRAARARQDRLTKPPGSLGRLEEISIQIAGIQRTDKPHLGAKTLVVAAGDHGVVAQGVTAYPQAVTAQMVLNFLAGGAAVSVMARHAGVRLVVVDAGVASNLPASPKILSLKIGRGTADISQGPAMSRAQAERCILEGAAIARQAANSGATIMGTGDMGIGNTTPSSAITAVLTGRSPEETTGPGTGRNKEELARKTEIVRRAIEVNSPRSKDALDVLARVGGFEIGVLAGVILGTAASRRPVVIDGFISGAAALIACGLCPTARDYIIASHRSGEPGAGPLLSHLKLQPVLDLGLRLGEGTGAVLAMGIIEQAAACLSEMATFDEARVSNRSDPGSPA